MPTFEQGDVVRVPFPYTDTERREFRPALVVSAGNIGPGGALLWVVMITDARHTRWAGDVDLSDIPTTILPKPSIARPAKIATIDADQATKRGTVPATAMGKVLANIQNFVAVP